MEKNSETSIRREAGKEKRLRVEKAQEEKEAMAKQKKFKKDKIREEHEARCANYRTRSEITPPQFITIYIQCQQVEDVDMKAAEDDAATVEAGQQSCAAEAAAAATPSAISFLYQLTPGLAQRSYGLNVARLAGYAWGST